MANDGTLLWLADTSGLTSSWFEAGAGWLAPGETERLGRFIREARRRQFVAGRILLRLILGELFGVAPRSVALLDQPGSAPVLQHPVHSGIGLSIAHSGDWVACAVSKVAPVGLDIERTDAARDLVALADQAFGSQAALDLMALEDGARTEAFYRMWCRHEARIKLGQAGAHDRFFSRPGLMLALSSTHALEVAPVLVDLDQFTPKSK